MKGMALAALAALTAHAASAAPSTLGESLPVDGLQRHLQANAERYQALGSRLRTLGLVPMNDRSDVRSDISLLGGITDAKDFGGAVHPGAPAAPGAGPGSALRDAQRLAGRPAQDVESIAQDNIAEFDPVTGQKLVKTEGDMYRAIIDSIVSARCRTGSAAGAFKSLLWGAVILEARQRDGQPWPEMVDETKKTWQRWVKAVEKGRKDFEKTGQPSADAAEGLPTINYKTQEELGGATATWDGNINVGDIFAKLSGPGKNAVLFHEYLHDSDSHTKAGVNDNYYSARLAEPDETPSGKNWTETLAYRNMGDWGAVLNLPWPRFKN